jgi:low affinity Fe/Cu permease
MKTKERTNRAASQTSRPSGFESFARWGARAAGRPVAFWLAVCVVVAWLVTGPLFRFSDTWQLVINTGTTIITFLMVFLIQSTQNRDSVAMHLKLDEIIRALSQAHNTVVNIEDLSQEELDKLKGRYEQLAERVQRATKNGKADMGCPELRQK